MYPHLLPLLRRSRAALWLALLAAVLQASLVVQSARHEVWRALYGPGAALQICSAGGSFDGLIPSAPVDPGAGEAKAQTWCAVCAAAAAVPVLPVQTAQPLQAESLAYVLPPWPATLAPQHFRHILPPARAPPALA